MRTAPLLLTLLLAASARAAAPEQVLITYEANVGARQISGVSHALEWRATALGPDAVKVTLRVPVDSFDSGHPEFDALLRAAALSERHPFVEVAGVAHGDRFEGTLTFRGVSRPLQLQLGMARLDGFLVANASFTLELADFGLALPSVGPKIAIDFIGRFPDVPRTVVISGGAVSASR